MSTCERFNAGLKIAGKLDALERTMDAALTQYGELVATLATARGEAGLSAVFGHKAFELITPIGEALVGARGGTVSLHQCLGAIQRRLGVTMGPLGDKEPDFALASAQGGPKLVEPTATEIAA